MLSIRKYEILDENSKTIAVQIPIEDFEKIEEIIENYGLSKLMDEIVDDEIMTVAEAKIYYNQLQK
jgi:hypothetical protein